MTQSMVRPKIRILPIGDPGPPGGPLGGPPGGPLGGPPGGPRGPPGGPLGGEPGHDGENVKKRGGGRKMIITIGI